MPEPLPPALRSLLEIGVSLARRTAAGRVGLARYAQVVDDAAVPDPMREPLRAELDAGWDAVVEPFSVKAPKGISIDKEPLAVTPTAQVFAGEFDGEPVAVKFARPGVAATIRAELSLLDTMAGPLRMIFGALDVRGVLKEVREAALDEFDLEHEAETQSRVRRALRRLDGVTVPEVHLDECTPALMVSELVSGGELTSGDRRRTAELLLAAHLVAWRDAGLVLTDSRPAHVLVTGDGIALLGTGLARPLSRDRLEGVMAAFDALASDDADAFVAAVDGSLEILPGDAAREAFPLLRGVLGEFLEGEAVLDAEALHRGAIRAYGCLAELLSLGARVTPEPGDVAAARMAGQLVATLARLEVKADWPALATAAASA